MNILNGGLFHYVEKMIPDRTLLKIKYKYHFKRTLDLENPRTFNEKLQWLKLNDRRPEYINYVDKYRVRDYVRKIIGDEYLIPLHAVYNSSNEINWSLLPDQFVLKCTHGSGCNIICSNKEEINIKESIKKIDKWMKRNWFWYGREWPYKYVEPRIICEKYMVDESGTELKDYKFFCFNGKPKLIQVDFNRFTNHKRNFYDVHWNYINMSIKYKNDPSIQIEKPTHFDKMLEMAEALSKGIPHVRVDFYSIYQKIYFGEMTFYHGSGFEKFDPAEYDELLGSWLDLPTRLKTYD